MTTNGKPSNARCVVYTRKSTEEGLEQEFNSLDAQRESAQAFIASQRHEGWTLLPDRYDDGGFTGGNMERPALNRLLADIRAGKIDCVIVCRSLLDFTKMMEVFDKHHVSFVAFTQQINTATPMGRLMLNVLMSFAQFERELISERTRDKIAAARRKGKWVGGHPILGYDIDPKGFKLIVNEDEASRVRAIFDLYLEHQSLLPVAHELRRRGWASKRWTTRKGIERGGGPFHKINLHQLLTNVAYTGKVRYKSEVFAAEHAPIIAVETWQNVQEMLKRNRRPSESIVPNRYGTLLKGILHCQACGCAMCPTHTRNQNKVYRYYVCYKAQRNGWNMCPSKSVPAAEIERIVADRIRSIGNEPDLLTDRLAQSDDQTPEQQPTSNDAALILSALDPNMRSQTPNEQARLIHLLIERIDFDGSKGKIAIHFHPAAIKILANELAAQHFGGKHMNERMTVECDFRFRRCGRGFRKEIVSGAEPPPQVPETVRIPRVTRLMALAIRFEQLLREGRVADYAELAELGHVTRARLTQIMNLTVMAPDLQEQILFLPRTKPGQRPILMRQLQPIALTLDWRRQRQMWKDLLR